MHGEKKSYLKWCASLGVSVSINSTKSLKTASISMSAREVCDQERLFHPSKYRGEIPRDEQAIMVTALSADRFSFLFFKISSPPENRSSSLKNPDLEFYPVYAIHFNTYTYKLSAAQI